MRGYLSVPGSAKVATARLAEMSAAFNASQRFVVGDRSTVVARRLCRWLPVTRRGHGSHVLAILANIADLHDGDTITVRRNEDPWTDPPAE